MTQISNVKESEELSLLLEDIGTKNSDVLLSNAVLFVEGPSDQKVLEIIAQKLDDELLEKNITIISISGGDNIKSAGATRSTLLSEISKKTPIPHHFILDRDEKTQTEISAIKKMLGNKVTILNSREIENYLVVPQAIKSALMKKYKDSPEILSQVKNLNVEQIESIILEIRKSLSDMVLIKQVRRQLGTLVGGFVSREMVVELLPHVRKKGFPGIMWRAVNSRYKDHISKEVVFKVVNLEKRKVDSKWKKTHLLYKYAPGTEVLKSVFESVGGNYRKTSDCVRIAEKIKRKDIPNELVKLVKKISTLS